MRKFGTAVAAAMALVGFAGSAQALTFVNGSFETSPVDPGQFTTLGSASTAIDGWTVGGNSIDYIGTYWTANQGSRSIDLAGNGDGSISQDISDMIVDQDYRITFRMSSNPDGAPSPKTLLMTLGAVSQIFETSKLVTAGAVDGWDTFTFDFKGVNSPLTLTFASTVGTAYGPALDNVSIEAVPEAGTWAMMLIGFGAIGAAMRRKRSIGGLATA